GREFRRLPALPAAPVRGARPLAAAAVAARAAVRARRRRLSEGGLGAEGAACEVDVPGARERPARRLSRQPLDRARRRAPCDVLEGPAPRARRLFGGRRAARAWRRSAARRSDRAGAVHRSEDLPGGRHSDEGRSGQHGAFARGARADPRSYVRRMGGGPVDEPEIQERLRKVHPKARARGVAARRCSVSPEDGVRRADLELVPRSALRDREGSRARRAAARNRLFRRSVPRANRRASPVGAAGQWCSAVVVADLRRVSEAQYRELSPIRLVTFSSLYPSRAAPSHGIFVEHRLRKLVATGGAHATVVCPVPWFPSSHPMFGAYALMAA